VREFLKNTMKILHISSEKQGWSGGAEQMFALSCGMRDRGHTVIVGCPTGSSIEEKAVTAGFNAIVLPMFNDIDFYSAIKLAFFCRRSGIDIVHAQHPRAHAVALLSSYFTRMPPLVVTRRVSFPIENNFPARWKYINSKIKKFICVANAVKRELEKFGVPADKLEVIYSGVNIKKFHPGERKGESFNAPVVGSVANFSHWKGQSVFLESSRIIRNKKPECCFLLAGRDTDSEKVKNLVNKHGIAEKTALLGFKNNVPEVMSNLTIFVCSSTGAEGLSGTLREAMAMGLPVVATDVGGNREIVKHMETGMLVPPRDPGAIAEAVIFLLDHSQDAKAMGERGRSLVSENFTTDMMVERTEKVYKKIVEA